jgi:hypothetical protein
VHGAALPCRLLERAAFIQLCSTFIVSYKRAWARVARPLWTFWSVEPRPAPSCCLASPSAQFVRRASPCSPVLVHVAILLHGRSARACWRPRLSLLDTPYLCVVTHDVWGFAVGAFLVAMSFWAGSTRVVLCCHCLGSSCRSLAPVLIAMFML